MGIVVADKIVLDALLAAQREVKSALDKWIPVIFDTRPAAEQDRIKKWYRQWLDAEAQPERQAAGQLKIFLGYPRAATEMPCMAVTIEESSESERAFANHVQDGADVDGLYQVKGSYANGTIGIHCIADNAELTTWLRAIAYFSMLFMRDAMEESGLDNQRLSERPFMVLPEWLPKPAFGMAVNLSSEYLNTYVVRVPIIGTVSMDALAAEETLSGVAMTGAEFTDESGNPL